MNIDYKFEKKKLMEFSANIFIIPSNNNIRKCIIILLNLSLNIDWSDEFILF